MSKKNQIFYFAFLIFCHFLTISYFFGLVFLLWLKIQPICLKSMPKKTDYLLSISRQVQNEVWSNIKIHKNHLLQKKILIFQFYEKFPLFLQKFLIVVVWHEFDKNLSRKYSHIIQ